MIQIPAILREIASFGGSLYKKGPPPIAVLHFYALFIEDEERIKRDCRYNIKPFLDNRAQNLGGYMWALSSIWQEQLQIRCLEETHLRSKSDPHYR